MPILLTEKDKRGIVASVQCAYAYVCMFKASKPCAWKIQHTCMHDLSLKRECDDELGASSQLYVVKVKRN